MCLLSRVAVGTIQPEADRRCVLGALYGILGRLELEVQPFLSRACFAACAAGARQAPRHLDSWLMTREVAVELFLHSARAADLALVEGEFRPRSELDVLYGLGDEDSLTLHEHGGACLETLCAWLDLPVLAIVDVSKISGCKMPVRPHRISGLLLDRVASAREASRWRTLFESLWDVPVLGAMEDTSARRAFDSLSAATPSEAVLRLLTDQLLEDFDMPGFLRVAEPRPLLGVGAHEAGLYVGGCPHEELASCGGQAPLKVAVAYDEAFHCYFPDTLDLLEARGATICDFSPLRDESLPADVDVVYLGCGCPEQYADPLAENPCMKQALRTYVEAGGRVYAEGGGLAYLCQQIVLPTGRRLPMVGALPAIAKRSPHPQPPQPAEVTARDNNWLAKRGDRLRGYLNSNWRIHPVGPLQSLAKEEAFATSLVGCRQVIGSRLHLNFAAQPAFLRRFFQPAPLINQASGR